jgi:hypothetical protein
MHPLTVVLGFALLATTFWYLFGGPRIRRNGKLLKYAYTFYLSSLCVKVWNDCKAVLFGFSLFRACSPRSTFVNLETLLILHRRPPNTLLFVGNGLQFLKARHELFSWFVKCERQFGFETFEISVPSLPPGVVINDPKNLEFVLKNEGIFSKGDFFKLRSWDLFGRLSNMTLIMGIRSVVWPIKR